MYSWSDGIDGTIGEVIAEADGVEEREYGENP